MIVVFSIGGTQQTKTSNNIALKASAISNDYNLDYVVWQHKRQYFYPGIGFGWMYFNYNFVNKGEVPASYPEAMQNFTGERNIQSGGLTYLNFAANYDWALDKTNDFLLGIRVNYHLGLNRKDIELSDGSDLAQSPVLKANAFSIGVALTVQ